MDMDVTDILNEAGIIMNEIKHDSYPVMHSKNEKRIFPAITQESIYEVTVSGKDVLDSEYGQP